MSIANFDYVNFAKTQVCQYAYLYPMTIDNDTKKYLLDKLYEYTSKAGKALLDDITIVITKEQAEFICNSIANTLHHIQICLIHSGVPKEYWESISQKVAFLTFEVSKKGIITSIPKAGIITALEANVDNVMAKTADELFNKGLILEETKRNILLRSFKALKEGIQNISEKREKEYKTYFKNFTNIYKLFIFVKRHSKKIVLLFIVFAIIGILFTIYFFNVI